MHDIKILLVCTGNVCRSPAAELILRHRLDLLGSGSQVASAGTAALVGEDLQPEMAALLDKAAIPRTSIPARQVTPDMIRDADLVLTMTLSQRSAVLGLDPKALRKTFTLTELAALITQAGRLRPLEDIASGRPMLQLAAGDHDIADPYRRSAARYRRAFASIMRAMDVIAPAVASDQSDVDVDVPDGAAPAAITVLESFPEPRSTTNPYIVMLSRSLEATPGVTVLNFSFRTALTGKYDVFHVHWPEILVSGASPLKKRVRQALFAQLLRRLERRRVPIVRTMHNLEMPTGISRREIALLERAERRTTLGIAINETTPAPMGLPTTTILHGHYRDWYDESVLAKSQRGRVAFFGLVRRYKGVDSLIRAFRDVPARRRLRLAIAGRPSSDELAGQLTELAGDDKRVELRFGFLTDDELAKHVTRAELVVLPYREMHNSGGVLTALSLGRAVLVPSNSTNAALADEVGPAWVQMYDGELSADDIVHALEAVRAGDNTGPDLSRREWDTAGTEHAAAFRRAISIRRSR